MANSADGDEKFEPNEAPLDPQLESENSADGEGISVLKSRLKADVPEFIPATTPMQPETNGNQSDPEEEDCDAQNFVSYDCPSGQFVPDMFYSAENVMQPAYHQQIYAVSPPYASYLAPSQFATEMDPYQTGLSSAGTYGSPMGFGMEPMTNGEVQFQGGGFVPVSTTSFSVYNPGLTGFVQFQPYFPPVQLTTSPRGESNPSRLRRNTAESEWSGQTYAGDDYQQSGGFLFSPIPRGDELNPYGNGVCGVEDIYDIEVGGRQPLAADGSGSGKDRDVPPRFKNLHNRRHPSGSSGGFAYVNPSNHQQLQGRVGWPAFDIWSNTAMEPIETDWDCQHQQHHSGNGGESGGQGEFTVGRWNPQSFGGHSYQHQSEYNCGGRQHHHWAQPGPSHSHPRAIRLPPPEGYSNLLRRHNKYLTESEAQTDFDEECWDRPLTDVVRCGHAKFIGRTNLDEVGLRPDCQPRTWMYRSRNFSSRLVQVPPPPDNSYVERTLEPSQRGFVSAPDHSRLALNAKDQSDRPTTAVATEQQTSSYSQALRRDGRNQNQSESGQMRNSMWGSARDTTSRPDNTEVADGPAPFTSVSRPVGRKAKETLSLADFMGNGSLKKTSTKQKNNKAAANSKLDSSVVALPTDKAAAKDKVIAAAGGNLLDSSSPAYHKGKVKSSKKKRPSAMRKTIAKEKEERNSVELTTSTDPVEDAAKSAIHSRTFRSYCDNLISSELRDKTTSFVAKLQQFQQNAFEKDPSKAKLRRRMVFGLKEVLKYAKVERLKCVLIATNVENIQSQGGLNDIVSEILTECRRQNLPWIFALTRHQLGKLTHKTPVLSAIGVLNYNGAEEIFKSLMAEGNRLKDLYKELLERKKAESVQSETVEIRNGVELEESVAAELAQLQLESNGQQIDDDNNLLLSQSDSDEQQSDVEDNIDDVDYSAAEEGDPV